MGVNTSIGMQGASLETLVIFDVRQCMFSSFPEQTDMAGLETVRMRIGGMGVETYFFFFFCSRTSRRVQAKTHQWISWLVRVVHQVDA